jgi:hypothetical protein
MKRPVDVCETGGRYTEERRESVFVCLYTGLLMKNPEVKCRMGEARLVLVYNTEIDCKEIRWGCAWDLSGS